jgi:hypothetical protein
VGVHLECGDMQADERERKASGSAGYFTIGDLVSSIDTICSNDMHQMRNEINAKRRTHFVKCRVPGLSMCLNKRPKIVGGD